MKKKLLCFFIPVFLIISLNGYSKTFYLASTFNPDDSSRYLYLFVSKDGINFDSISGSSHVQTPYEDCRDNSTFCSPGSSFDNGLIRDPAIMYHPDPKTGEYAFFLAYVLGRGGREKVRILKSWDLKHWEFITSFVVENEPNFWGWGVLWNIDDNGKAHLTIQGGYLGVDSIIGPYILDTPSDNFYKWPAAIPLRKIKGYWNDPGFNTMVNQKIFKAGDDDYYMFLYNYNLEIARNDTQFPDNATDGYVLARDSSQINEFFADDPEHNRNCRFNPNCDDPNDKENFNVIQLDNGTYRLYFYEHYRDLDMVPHGFITYAAESSDLLNWSLPLIRTSWNLGDGDTLAEDHKVIIELDDPKPKITWGPAPLKPRGFYLSANPSKPTAVKADKNSIAWLYSDDTVMSPCVNYSLADDVTNRFYYREYDPKENQIENNNEWKVLITENKSLGSSAAAYVDTRKLMGKKTFFQVKVEVEDCNGQKTQGGHGYYYIRVEHESITLMTYNRLAATSGADSNETKNVIRKIDADIIALQEGSDSISEISSLLPEYNVYRANRPLGEAIFSKYPIAATYGHGAKIELPNNEYIYVFNIHLPGGGWCYEPISLKRCEINPDTNLCGSDCSNFDPVQSSYDQRNDELMVLMNDINSLVNFGSDGNPDYPIFVMGDFNEPSYLDWKAIHWPASLLMQQNNFTDAYKEINPDKTGITWPTVNHPSLMDMYDLLPHNRIDLIYYRGNNVIIKEADTIGKDNNESDIGLETYNSDHRAVSASFNIYYQKQPGVRII